MRAWAFTIRNALPQDCEPDTRGPSHSLATQSRRASFGGKACDVYHGDRVCLRVRVQPVFRRSFQEPLRLPTARVSEELYTARRQEGSRMKQTGKPLCPSIMMDHKDLLEDWAGFSGGAFICRQLVRRFRKRSPRWGAVPHMHILFSFPYLSCSATGSATIRL
jgi:hypothetical protein